MAIRGIHIGPIENWIQFDDLDFYSDGITPFGMIVPVQPTTDDGVVRKVDLGDTAVNPLADEPVLMATPTGTDFINRRIITDSPTVLVSDGGAGGNLSLSTVQDIQVTAKPTFDGLTLTGSIQLQHVSIDSLSSPYTVGDETVIIADATGGNITVNLPAAAGATGRLYHVKKIDASANTVTLDGDGTETIDDALTQVLTAQYESVMIFSDGSEWWIL